MAHVDTSEIGLILLVSYVSDFPIKRRSPRCFHTNKAALLDTAAAGPCRVGICGKSRRRDMYDLNYVEN